MTGPDQTISQTPGKEDVSGLTDAPADPLEGIPPEVIERTFPYDTDTTGGCG